MPQSELRLIKRSAEFIRKERIKFLPRGLRGIYVLYNQGRARQTTKFDVVYVGMGAAGLRGGIRGRLKSHLRTKGDLDEA